MQLINSLKSFHYSWSIYANFFVVVGINPNTNQHIKWITYIAYFSTSIFPTIEHTYTHSDIKYNNLNMCSKHVRFDFLDKIILGKYPRSHTHVAVCSLTIQIDEHIKYYFVCILSFSHSIAITQYLPSLFLVLSLAVDTPCVHENFRFYQEKKEKY